MFFIQVLQVDFLADFQFTQVYTGLLFLPPDGSRAGADDSRLVKASQAEAGPGASAPPRLEPPAADAADEK